ncbi:hypothetical protein QAD02_004850 [Eretmocerus hayati]|uniref:Uncharacterized protein n=1 Tax=Eretmocerus hayati TaxID=131215 RepID=A0ACC2NRT6_9HYME|nr:hypothetical protein QAD02_004850 [Eretmocerus hayati]
MASVGKHGPDKVPPDISFKCHPKKTAGIVVCLLCEGVFHKSDFLDTIKTGKFISSVFVICNDHSDVDLTSTSDNTHVVVANLTERLAKYQNCYKQLEVKYKEVGNRQNQENTALTYAQTAAMKSNQSIVNVPDIIIELQGQDKEKEKSTKQIKKTLSEKTNCPINKLKEVKNKIYIKCRDPKDIQKVSEVLLKEENLKINIEVEKMKEPRINVVGVDPCMIDTDDGIIKGDEIMVINGAIVSDLDMMYLESVLQEEQALCMMMRSSRVEPPDLNGIMRVTDDIIESLVCPPPPTDPPVISEEMISGLIVPAPNWSKEQLPEIGSDGSKQASRTSSFEIENLLKTAEQVTGICRSPNDTRKSSPTGSMLSGQSQMLTPSRQLTDAEKLKKVILELVETERAYVKHLNSLLENYLEPLKRETFLSNAEINALFGNIQEIVTFQRQFLQNLDHAIEVEADFNNFEHPSQFKGVLFSIGSAFLCYVNHFKLYSSFCASHSKAQKVLHPNEGNQALQEFLQARNPRQQHSSTLESYLIKPIQRILKYPLLLQQLRNLTDERSEEHQHLIEALKGMEKVAEHINEMQRIHEEYGAIFDHLFRQHQKSCKQPIDLSPGDLLYYGGVEWLNISDFLGKIKKGLELHAMCFVFKSAVVFLCKEKLRQKKKLMGGSSKANAQKATGDVEIIRYQVLIPVTEVQVRSSSAKDMESHFLWELIHLRSQLQRRSEKVYVLSNSTSEFRNSFLKTIRQIIRESVRNMSIPSTRSQALMSGHHQPMTISPRMTTSHSDKSATGDGGPMPTLAPIPPSLPTGKLSKKAMKQQQMLATRRKFSKQPVDRDSSEDKDADEIHFQHQQHRQQQQLAFRTRSKTISDSTGEVKVEMDSGTKSEGEEDAQAYLGEKKTSLGRTPNHLTLSTTSTISAGSNGSQAKLIQSSHHPENYQPPAVKELGSPVWKPRELPSVGEATTLPRKGKASGTSNEFGPGVSSRHSTSRKSLAEINNTTTTTTTVQQHHHHV